MNYQEADLLEQLQEVDAHEFEQFIADLWERQQWQTRVTKAADDGGVDVIAEQSAPVPQKQAIQAKRYGQSNSVGRPEVQQYASIREEQTDVDTVVIVTTSRFTDGAIEVAKRLNVKLIDGTRLYNLVDALDAFELAHSYIESTAEPAVTGAIDRAPDTAGSPSTEAESSATTVDMEIDRGDELKDVPTILPEMVLLRQEITTELERIHSIIDAAETAFYQEEYFDAVEQYQTGNERRRSVERKIARYDAGLTNIVPDTAEQLPPTEQYTAQLADLFDGVADRFREAFGIAEQVRGLDLLRDEILEQVEAIQGRLDHGDDRRQKGDIETAQSAYEATREELASVRQTMEIYRGLLSEAETPVVQSRSGNPEELSLDALGSEIDDRIDTQDEYVDRAASAADAAGSFDAGILTGNDGELFEQDLVEYLEDSEQPEYVFQPPRLGFKIIPADGAEAPPEHDAMESGSCFLVITDQRILYVAGVDDHDVTESIAFDQLTTVEGTTEEPSPSLAFGVESGETYQFGGLRDNLSDLPAAVEFLRDRS